MVNILLERGKKILQIYHCDLGSNRIYTENGKSQCIFRLNPNHNGIFTEYFAHFYQCRGGLCTSHCLSANNDSTTGCFTYLACQSNPAEAG
jgi:hypothetical protein